MIVKQYFFNKNNSIIYLEVDSYVLKLLAELFAYILHDGEAYGSESW